MKAVWTFILIMGGALFLLIGTYLAQVYNGAQEAGTTPEYFAATQSQKIALKFALVIIAMLAGIISQYVFEKAKDARDSKINLRSVLSRMVTNSRFIMALFVSPLIFNSIYLIIGANPQSIGDYLLAFQNGFFWQSVISGISAADSSTTKNTS